MRAWRDEVDLLVFTETWRDEQSEVWTTEQGHTWYGSGGSRGQRGGGFLLNQRWERAAFKPISNRVDVLEVFVEMGMKLNAVAV